MSGHGPALFLRCFCNQPVHVNADLGGCVLYMLAEFKHSKALVSVLHQYAPDNQIGGLTGGAARRLWP
jgi:hypothetical protein